MKYVVINAFNDLTDGDFLYKVGDVYPREGTHPTNERISELASDANMQRKVLITLSESKNVESNNNEDHTPPKRKRGKRNENN